MLCFIDDLGYLIAQAVYKMPTDVDDPVKSVPLALQRLFYDLQHR